LNSTVHKNLGKDLDTGGGETAPDELIMGIAHAPVHRELVQQGDAEATVIVVAQGRAANVGAMPKMDGGKRANKDRTLSGHGRSQPRHKKVVHLTIHDLPNGDARKHGVREELGHRADESSAAQPPIRPEGSLSPVTNLNGRQVVIQ
jgi:hypothetical protein